MFFWTIKVLILLLGGLCIGVLLAIDHQSLRGVGAAMLMGLMTLGLSLKHGLSKRQWRRKDYQGLNQVIVYFGYTLWGVVGAIVLGWIVYAVIEGDLTV